MANDIPHLQEKLFEDSQTRMQITCLAISSGIIIAGCDDFRLRFWREDQTVKSKPFKCLLLPIPILSIAFDGKTVVIGSTKGRFIKFLRTTGYVGSSLIRKLPGTTAGIQIVQIKGEIVAFGAGGNIIISDTTSPDRLIPYACDSEILQLKFLESHGEETIHRFAAAIMEGSDLAIVYLDIEGNLSALRDSRTELFPGYDQCLDIQSSSGDILVFHDSLVTVLTIWDQRIWKKHEHFNGEDNSVGLGCFLRDGHIVHTAHGYPRLWLTNGKQQSKEYSWAADCDLDEPELNDVALFKHIASDTTGFALSWRNEESTADAVIFFQYVSNRFWEGRKFPAYYTHRLDGKI